MSESRYGSIKSSVVIAKLLASEGFSDNVSQAVESYYRRRAGLTERQKKSIVRLREELTEMCLKLTEGEKLVLGKFIGLQKKMSFDTGLKIGLTCFANDNAKDVESEYAEVTDEGD